MNSQRVKIGDDKFYTFSSGNVIFISQINPYGLITDSENKLHLFKTGRVGYKVGDRLMFRKLGNKKTVEVFPEPDRIGLKNSCWRKWLIYFIAFVSLALAACLLGELI